uniref:Plakophilin-4 n=1 Tax=Elaeophora elaphi TaxID=1147741 RepID=A0A0R3S7B0_9BILA
MEYSGQKQYELARSSSRFSALDGLSRASSRSNIDMFYDTGRLSRVDSYVRDLNRNTEYGFPSSYAKYRSPSRPYLPQEYTPINGYRVRCLK